MMTKRIWMVHPTDALPGENGYKHGINLIEELDKKGYEVTWWTSSFSHTLKKQRVEKFSDIPYKSRSRILLIPTSEYKKHIGFKRIFQSVNFYMNWYKLASRKKSPEILIKSSPDLFGDFFVLKFLKRRKLKLVIDFRDLWPEVFISVLPNFLQKFEKIIFWPFYQIRKRFFSRSDGIISVSKDYDVLAKKISPSLINKPSAISYHCNLSIEEKVSLETLMKKDYSGELKIIYAGNLGKNYDMLTVLKAMQKITENEFPISFIIAGSGPYENQVKKAELNSNGNIKYLGMLNMKELTSLYSMSHLALAPYSKNSTVSMPAKAYELMFNGLPVITSLGREYGEIVKREAIGFFYEASSVNSLTKVLSDILINRKKLKEMSIKSLSLAEKYNVDDQIEKYDEVLKKILI